MIKCLLLAQIFSLYPGLQARLLPLTRPSQVLDDGRYQTDLLLRPTNQTSSLQVGPTEPPPLPWNEYTCRFDDLYAIYLTFSFGTTLSRAAIRSLLVRCINDLRAEIAQGAGREIAGASVHIVINEVALTLENRLQRITFAGALAVMELLERCGLERGYREEMWAVMFDREGRRLGTVTMRLWREPDE
ncbi:MAG: hypothetical protein LQ348_001830 [Seirophora lacunosa]|nr:MAG: hypothetical protein LQ348_001830 [Seirophora lacunosa]